MIDYQKEYRQFHRIAAELHLRNERLLDRLDAQKEEIERLRAENEELRKERNTADAHLFPLKFEFENWKIYNVTYAKERKIEELRAETKRLRSNLEGKP